MERRTIVSVSFATARRYAYYDVRFRVSVQVNSSLPGRENIVGTPVT
jgi:hypothetical protein